MMPQIPRQGAMQPGPPRMRPGFGGRAPMMGMNQRPMSPMMGMNQRPMSPMMGMNRMPGRQLMGGAQQMNRGGGLFSRLLGMGNQSSRMGGLMGMQQAGRAAGAGGSMFGNSGGLMGFLNNTQQVLKTAQSLGPMVQQFQQYGSLVKNIPAMWKLYRGLKNAPSETESKKTESKNTKDKTSSSHQNKQSSKTSSTKRSSKPNVESSSETKQENGSRNKQKTANANSKGSSLPKLYI